MTNLKIQPGLLNYSNLWSTTPSGQKKETYLFQLPQFCLLMTELEMLSASDSAIKSQEGQVIEAF